MKYTKEEKQKYFKELREKWAEAKEKSLNDSDAKSKWEAINQEAGGKISYTGFYFTFMDMQAQGLDGLPYVDAKTFQGWLQSGFQVVKGAKSTLSGITWLEVKNKGATADDDGFLMPKEYHLFHRSQVEEIIK